jgi:hypothetical protein
LSIEKKLGLTVDVQNSTFTYLISIFQTTTSIYLNQEWDKMEHAICVWGLITSMRLLKSHLYTALYLHIPEKETGLNKAIKLEIYEIL